MLRKWRRGMKRRLEDELGRLSIKSGLMVSAVFGSAISVFLYTTNISEITVRTNAVIIPPTTIISDKNVNLLPRSPEYKTAQYDASTEKNVIEESKPIMVEQPVREIPKQFVETNNVGVQDQSANNSFEQVAPKKTIIAVQEQVLLSNDSRDVANITPADVSVKEQTGENMLNLVVVQEKIIPEKQDALVGKRVDDSLKRVPAIVSVKKAGVKDVSLITKEQKNEVKISKVDKLRKVNISTKGKNGQNMSKPLVVREKVISKKQDEPVIKSNIPIVAKVAIAGAEIELGHVSSSEAIKPISNGKDAHTLEVSMPVIVEATIEKDLNPIAIIKQVGTNDSMEEQLLTSVPVMIQTVNSSPDNYTIRDRSDGVTSMTMTPKMNEIMVAPTSIISSTDITVFQVKNSEVSYNGTYYIENSKRELTMAQRIANGVRQPNSDSTKVQGTYMTMDWKDNPKGDFFVGFNGSALVVYPLDDEAKGIVRDTDFVNNRPIVAASIIEAVGAMKLNLAQIQSVSIYAD